jgi:phosphoribosylaminoimidazolecarboxamide formyltransferase/IMP cyclohydrolase
MRYGENPHQTAAFYKEISRYEGGLASAKQLHGKELSFNNINDANGAIALIKEFDEAAVAAVKHTNPCGVGVSVENDILKAYLAAYATDPVSIYGGIVAANREINRETAAELAKIFLEIIVAPSFSPEALEILRQKKNIRLLELPLIAERQVGVADMKKVLGG